MVSTSSTGLNFQLETASTEGRLSARLVLETTFTLPVLPSGLSSKATRTTPEGRSRSSAAGSLGSSVRSATTSRLITGATGSGVEGIAATGSGAGAGSTTGATCTAAG